MDRVGKFHAVATDLRGELVEEVKAVEGLVLGPLGDIKVCFVMNLGWVGVLMEGG